jgi:hypothetical protein
MPTKFNNNDYKNNDYKNNDYDTDYDTAGMDWIHSNLKEMGIKVNKDLNINYNNTNITNSSSQIFIENYIGKPKKYCLKDFEKLRKRELQINSLLLC